MFKPRTQKLYVGHTVHKIVVYDLNSSGVITGAECKVLKKQDFLTP